jgi:hypothetical protein
MSAHNHEVKGLYLTLGSQTVRTSQVPEARCLWHGIIVADTCKRYLNKPLVLSEALPCRICTRSATGRPPLVAVKVELSYERAELLPDRNFKPSGMVASRPRHHDLRNKQPFRCLVPPQMSRWDRRSKAVASSR